MTRKLFAWLNLSWHFALHATTRLPLRRFRSGRDLQRFAQATNAEGYVPLDPAARLEFPRYMNCLHCGLCALACPPLQSRPGSAWEEAWTFVAGSSRSLDRARLVAQELSDCALTESVERACPAGIPINHMAASIRRIAGA